MVRACHRYVDEPSPGRKALVAGRSTLRWTASMVAGRARILTRGAGSCYPADSNNQKTGGSCV